MRRIRDLEVTCQKARTALKDEGRPGLTLQQDHYRIAQQLADVRKILGVTPDPISGGSGG